MLSRWMWDDDSRVVQYRCETEAQLLGASMNTPTDSYLFLLITFFLIPGTQLKEDIPTPTTLTSPSHPSPAPFTG
ncbi:hypothetical protein BP00DRAFT_44998 [Aspergillus indologenus CBS 114.80]|uniref:Uncharacterized protein n=1 Tax=Aspergillus indologenus CBS 114.80 TaxID=1450541 RepID=A0A2V5ISD8_9EURO|nr:hypothetical protein BP00DRAFT_44998 [Aspergillus indologenus CBS 114.80]